AAADRAKSPTVAASPHSPGAAETLSRDAARTNRGVRADGHSTRVLQTIVSRTRVGITRARSLYWEARGRTGIAGVGIRILFYHRVADDRDELAVSPHRFRAQMDFLASEGYRVVDIVEATELLDRGELPGRVIGLSFDDG